MGCDGVLVAAVFLVSGSAPERMEGVIALSKPQCSFFVVSTSDRFLLLNETDYFGVFEGDRVRGVFEDIGIQDVELVGETTIQVTIEGWRSTLRDAARVFYKRCGMNPDARDTQE